MASRWWTNDTIAVVTGANKGIGFEIVKQLAREGITVVLTARNVQRGEAATQQLKNQGLSSVVFHQLDVLSDKSISVLASWLKEHYNGFDILFNNAAVEYAEPSNPSLEDTENVINTNYISVKRVTQILLPLLRPSEAGARIVNVSSAVGKLELLNNLELRHTIGTIDNLTEDELDMFVEKYLQDVKDNKVQENGWPRNAYRVSKMALNAYTRMLSRALEHRPDGQCIYVNCATPGRCRTDLTQNDGNYTAEQGAETLVYVALLPAKGPTGKFFNRKNIDSF